MTDGTKCLAVNSNGIVAISNLFEQPIDNHIISKIVFFGWDKILDKEYRIVRNRTIFWP